MGIEVCDGGDGDGNEAVRIAIPSLANTSLGQVCSPHGPLLQIPYSNPIS